MNIGHTMRWINRRTGILTLLAAAALALLGSAAPARAALALTNASVSVSNPDGTFSRQAGAHPDLIVRFDFPHDPTTGVVSENVKDVRVDLPPGMVGNPTAAPRCAVNLLVFSDDHRAHCPPESQVGVGLIGGSADPLASITKVPIFNMEHSSDVPGLFAFNLLGVPIFLQPQDRKSVV